MVIIIIIFITIISIIYHLFSLVLWEGKTRAIFNKAGSLISLVEPFSQLISDCLYRKPAVFNHYVTDYYNYYELFIINYFLFLSISGKEKHVQLSTKLVP